MDYFDELYHYGIKGMKWGVRRTPEQLGRKQTFKEALSEMTEYHRDYKTGSRIRRQVAASKKNLKTRAKMMDADKADIEDAQANYRKALQKVTIFQKKKRERIHDATIELQESMKKAEESSGEYLRAKRIYQKNYDRLVSHTNKMLEKWDSKAVRELTVSERQLGEYTSETLLNTGITMANIPIIGSLYTGSYISKVDAADRGKRFKRKVSKQY